MLVAEGAQSFALDLGFPKENLLTDDARKIWMLWKENNSQMDWWGPSMTEPGWKDPYADKPAPKPTMDLHGLSSLRQDSPTQIAPSPSSQQPVRASCPVTPRQNGQRPSASVRRS